jgi:RNA polymerase sigma factor (sigma-70 family)
MVWGLCRRIVPDRHAAEDCFQATWLVFVRRAASIRQPERLGNWLYGVAHKVAARARADLCRQQTVERDGVERPDPLGEHDAETLELGRALHEELTRLPTRSRTALVLCYLEGRSQQEAAEVLGWTPGAVRGQLERGRRQLRTRLVRRGLVLSTAALAQALGAEAPAAALPALLARSTALVALRFLMHDGSQLGAAPAAIILAEGVCRVMDMAKWKLILVLVLATGLLSGAAGWLAQRAPEAAYAAPHLEPQQLPAEKARAREPAPEEQRPVRLADVRAEARKLEAELEDRELVWAKELLEARREMVTQEEMLRGLQRDHEAQRLRERADLQVAHIKVDAARQTNATNERILSDMRSKAAPKSPKDASTDYQRLTEQRAEGLKESAAAIKTAEANFDKVQAQVSAQESTRMHDLIEARVDLLAAQDKVQHIERRQDRQRDRLLAELDAARERIRHLREPDARERPADLERKLDRLQREVEALRRELRQAPDRGGRPGRVLDRD